MDAPWAREQLRRRYLFPPEVELDCEEEAKPETPTAVERKERPLPRLNIHSGFWILASIVVTYYVDFFKTFKENFHTNSWFLFGGALLFVSLSIAFYCIVYLEWYRGIEEYDVKYPTLVPITTATFIAAGVCHAVGLLTVGVVWKDATKNSLPSAGLLCVYIFPERFNLALWNVWSFFTPLLLFTQFMGVVMFISLLG